MTHKHSATKTKEQGRSQNWPSRSMSSVFRFTQAWVKSMWRKIFQPVPWLLSPALQGTKEAGSLFSLGVQSQLEQQSKAPISKIKVQRAKLELAKYRVVCWAQQWKVTAVAHHHPTRPQALLSTLTPHPVHLTSCSESCWEYSSHIWTK